LLFHDRLPPMECLWIRIRFDDGETVEGIIHNALDYIVGPGFFMAPGRSHRQQLADLRGQEQVDWV
jgi:hypothetical protein